VSWEDIAHGFAIISPNLHALKIELISRRNIQYQGEVPKYNSSEALIEQLPEAHRAFQQSIKKF